MAATIHRHSVQKRTRKDQSSCTVDGDVDRISQLPTEILHHILSFLPTRDAVRVSVLSKEWNDLFNSFPMSDFSEPSYPRRDRQLKFPVFVRDSVLRQCRQNEGIQKLRLSLFRYCYTSQLAHLIDHCIQLAVDYGVKYLDLELNWEYHLPLATLPSEELVVCRLAGCSLSLNFPVEVSAYWPSLRELSLKRVRIPEASSIDDLISHCPSIEKISLICCSSKLKYLRLFGFKKLDNIEVMNCLIDKIEVDALSLRTFSFSNQSCGETQINLIDCKNLEVLKFHCDTIPAWVSQGLTSIFPALRVFVVVSNQQLEKLQLCSDNLVQAIIEAPRLQSLEYGFQKPPSLFSLNKESLREVTLKLFLDDLHSEYSFPNLREVVGNFSEIKNLTLQIGNRGSIFNGVPKIGRNNYKPPLIDINRLQLKVNLNYEVEAVMAHEALVEGLFSICHPERLLLESGWGTNKEFMKVLCKNIINRDRRCNYTATYIKFPLQGLKAALIEHHGRNGYRKTLTCFDLLGSLQTVAPPQGNIEFVFGW